MGRLKSVIPGLAVLLGIGLIARAIATAFPVTNYLVLAIVLGLLIGNLYGIPRWADPGVSTHSLWLEAGIVIMGASVALDRVVAAGPIILVLVVSTVFLTILSVEGLARGLFGIQTKVKSLLAAGSSICGVSAVVATAGSIKADERDIAYAAATILLFDAMTLFVYPVIGRGLGLSDTVFGIWAGLTMFSTGPVTAAGFAFSDTAGEWAVLVKLTRNALIGVTALGYAFFYARKDGAEDTAGLLPSGWRYLWQSFPKFVLGFFLIMILANSSVLNNQQIGSLEHASNWLFLLAFAGLGLEIQLSDMRSTGVKPILLVLTTLTLISTVLLCILTYLF